MHACLFACLEETGMEIIKLWPSDGIYMYHDQVGHKWQVASICAMMVKVVHSYVHCLCIDSFNSSNSAGSPAKTLEKLNSALIYSALSDCSDLDKCGKTSLNGDFSSYSNDIGIILIATESAPQLYPGATELTWVGLVTWYAHALLSINWRIWYRKGI